MNVFGDYDKKMTGLDLSFDAGKNEKRQFYLPEELVLQIFKFLNCVELFTTGSVCKRWLNMTKNPFLQNCRYSLKTSDDYATALSEVFLKRSQNAYRSYVYEEDLTCTFRVEKVNKAISMFIGTSIISPHFTISEVITCKVKIDRCSGVFSKISSDIKELVCKRKLDLETITNPLEWKYRCRYWNYSLAKYEIKIFDDTSLDLGSIIILRKCLDKLNQRLLKKPLLLCKVQQYIPTNELLSYYMG